MIFVWLDRLTNVWVGDAVIPFDYFPPRINKFMGTDVHNTGKTPEEVRYEVVAPMPGNNRFQESQNVAFILNKTTLSLTLTKILCNLLFFTAVCSTWNLSYTILWLFNSFISCKNGPNLFLYDFRSICRFPQAGRLHRHRFREPSARKRERDDVEDLGRRDCPSHSTKQRKPFIFSVNQFRLQTFICNLWILKVVRTYTYLLLIVV